MTHVIFSSTASVYGMPERVPISEDAVTRPINPYGRSKLAFEGLLESYATAYGLRYTCLRYFNACGADPSGQIGEAHSPETHLIPNVLRVALGQRERIALYGDRLPDAGRHLYPRLYSRRRFGLARMCWRWSGCATAALPACITSATGWAPPIGRSSKHAAR